MFDVSTYCAHVKRMKSSIKNLRKAYASEPDPIYPGAFRWLGVKPLEKAKIATDLAPLAKTHLGKRSHLYVVGYDCPNLANPDYTAWEQFLVDACKKGCKLTYYLGKKSASVIKRFQLIAKSSGARPKQIKIYVRDRAGGDFSKGYADQWKRFHFVVFEKPRQLWIETNHTEGETEAQNCYYLPPSKARNEVLLDTCKDRFELVIRECAFLAFQS